MDDGGVARYQGLLLNVESSVSPTTLPSLPTTPTLTAFPDFDFGSPRWPKLDKLARCSINHADWGLPSPTTRPTTSIHGLSGRKLLQVRQRVGQPPAEQLATGARVRGAQRPALGRRWGPAAASSGRRDNSASPPSGNGPADQVLGNVYCGQPRLHDVRDMRPDSKSGGFRSESDRHVRQRRTQCGARAGLLWFRPFAEQEIQDHRAVYPASARRSVQHPEPHRFRGWFRSVRTGGRRVFNCGEHKSTGSSNFGQITSSTIRASCSSP